MAWTHCSLLSTGQIGVMILPATILSQKGKSQLQAKYATGWRLTMKKGADPIPSPDGKYTAFIKNDNVYVKEVATGKEKQLSNDGTLSNHYSSFISWSPDGLSYILPHPPCRETVHLLCGILSVHPVAANLAQARICKAR